MRLPEPIDYFETPNGMTGIILAFVLIFFAFIGFEDMANIAEEVKRPQKTLPRAIILSVVISGVIYILVSLSVVRVINWEELGQSAAPLAAVAEEIVRNSGQYHIIRNCTFCHSQYSSNHTSSWF